jgi:hypothetical protein
MLFAVGTKVKFLHTGDEGVVTGLLEGGMINVYIEASDMEIPAFPDDLFRAEEYSKKPVKAKIVEGKKEAPAPTPPPIPIETQYTILKSFGIQLAFEPIWNQEGLTEKYLVYLLNDTNYAVVYTVRFLRNNARPATWDGRLNKTSFVKFGEMVYDDLNEAPEFEVECTWTTTEGGIGPVFKSLKIKPKSFFNSLRTAPLLNKKVHLYRLFEKPESDTEQTGEDLREYTKRHARPTWPKMESFKNLNVHDTKELSEFEPEIDLHIEKLTDNWRKMSNTEIVRMQLSHFEAYLAKAIHLGVPRVYIIHGVGEGRLRDAIATRLMQNPDVVTFKNEYHHKYGWGATEVVF